MNKPVYLGLSILEISKTLMYDFWYDYIKPKYQYNAKLWESVRNKMENVRKQKRDIKLVTAERRRNYLVSEPSYHATKYFSENLLAIEMKKKKKKK